MVLFDRAPEDWIGSVEALRMASKKDDELALRLSKGEQREQIAEEAEPFFHQLMGLGRQKPGHFTEEDWRQLKLIRDQWV